jgi:DNA-binding SARP family transcriptional activator
MSGRPGAGGDPQLDFALLGPLRVYRGDAELDPGPRLQRALLAILLTELRRVVPADRLIELLWRDAPPAAALASVQAYVSQLRRVLEPGRPAREPARILVTRDPGYLLQVTDEQVDVLRFRALVRQANADLAAGQAEAAAQRLDEALSAWRGDPLQEFASQPWALPVAASLEEAHDLAAEDRIDAWLSLGRHTTAVAELEAMVARRPLRERRWQQLIVAAYRCGSQADALRAYQRCRAVLDTELGLEPGPELRRLESAVLAQDPLLDWRPPTPAPATPAAPTPAQAAAPTARSALVGRDAELGRLAARIQQAAAGHGGAVVLTGGPGAGKTTLAAEAARLAADGGASTVWGRCLDAASAPAYWPWSQVLRGLPDGPRARAAARQLDGSAGQGEDDSARQFRVYEAMTAALAEAAAGAPLLAVIDDLHAADDASLALLQLLAGDLHRMPALLIFTTRETEQSRQLTHALGELIRHPGAERVPVGGFQPADVAALLGQLLDEEPSAEVVAALTTRTGGNPFYVTELTRLLASERRGQPLTADDVTTLDVPSGVRDVLLRRVARLPDGTRSLLEIAAVAGRVLEPDLLARLTGLDAGELLPRLEPAVTAGLVTAAGDGWGMEFRHPLVDESLRASMGRVERARLHARVAAALESSRTSPPDSRTARLAHHFAAAGPFGDPAKAVRYARAAAAQADRQGAWQDAIRHLEQALAMLTSAAPSTVPDSDAVRCDVLVELGRARRSAGRIEAAHTAFQESIGLADQIGDEDRVLAAAVAFGAPQLWGPRDWGEVDRDLVALLERQLQRVGDSDPGRRIRILATLAHEQFFGAAALRGWEHAQAALTEAWAYGKSAELGIAASAYLLSAVAADYVPDVPAVYGPLLSGEPRLAPRAEAMVRASLLTERIRHGELALFDSEFPEVWRLAADVLRSPELAGQLYFVQASRYLIAGEVTRAEELAEAGFRTLGDLVPTWRQPQRIALETCLGLVTGTLASRAEELLAQAARPDHPSVPHLAAPAAALGFALRGDLAAARSVARQWFAPPPRSWAWPQAIYYWSQVAFHVGVPDVAWLRDRLAPHGGELAIVGGGADCGGAVDSLRAGLAWRLGDHAEATRLAEAGLALDARVGSPGWVKRSTDLLARVREPLPAG